MIFVFCIVFNVAPRNRYSDHSASQGADEEFCQILARSSEDSQVQNQGAKVGAVQASVSQLHRSYYLTTFLNTVTEFKPRQQPWQVTTVMVLWWHGFDSDVASFGAYYEQGRFCKGFIHMDMHIL